MNIKIPTTHRQYFRQALEIMKSIPPLNSLRNKELDVLGQLLYFNHVYGDLEPAIRGKVIFDYDTKIDMMEYIGMDEASFNNNLTSLRKNKILKGRSIISTFGLNTTSPDITFKFLIGNAS